jgi:hypothetical protein
MISLGDNWLLKDTRLYHACGPALIHHWTGGRVCDCGIVVPQRVRAFQRWLRQQQRRDQHTRSGDPAAAEPSRAQARGTGSPPEVSAAIVPEPPGELAHRHR